MAVKCAVLLLTMGGPNTLDEVRPFLFNLFKDPAIIRLPSFLRLPLAFLISGLRAKEAKEIYARIGGASPLTANTIAQAAALDKELKKETDKDYKCFVGMSYAHPLVGEAMEDIREYNPDEIILLPLYPQFSTTTNKPSLELAEKEIARKNIRAKIYRIKHFPELSGMIDVWAQRIRAAKKSFPTEQKTKILFSAHGLPESIVKAGDPYAKECELTARLVAQASGLDETEWTLCYQSRVGPARWIGPSTSDEIKAAGKKGEALIVAPIAFVSEHSETLYELGQLYRDLAKEQGVPQYEVIETPGTAEAFIKDLAERIRVR